MYIDERTNDDVNDDKNNDNAVDEEDVVNKGCVELRKRTTSGEHFDVGEV